MNALRFEWDEQKNLLNIAKHQVSFDKARTVFSDANARVIDDPDHSGDENASLSWVSVRDFGF